MNIKPEFTRKEIEAVSQSAEARQLLHLLQKDGGSGLAQASEAMKKGEYAKAASILKPLLQAPDTESLMQELNRKFGRN